MPFFSRVFKDKKSGAKDANAKKPAEHTNGYSIAPAKPRYASNWDSTEVLAEEVEELIHLCTLEVKSRAEALDTPFLLLPFRPETDISAPRTFIRNFFKANREGSHDFRGAALQKELRLTEPYVLCSIVKWCWSRIPGGVVSWSVYEGFRIGELESYMARNAFDTFIPLGVESNSRTNIIYDFYDLLASIAAHGKNNGLGGRKLSRMAGWWAFEHNDTGVGFEGGYKSWSEAADASSHLFFGYLRSRVPDAVEGSGIQGISNLPRSLQSLLAQTEYPPEAPAMLQTPTSKVVMMVESVSATPIALLRRATQFEYRSEDRALQRFVDSPDPTRNLTPECTRVLDCIASTNQSVARSRRGNLANARLPSGLSLSGDDSWSRFQDEGFSSISPDHQTPATSTRTSPQIGSMQSQAKSRGMAGDRPTTPSWADFLNSGFADDSRSKSTPALMLPLDKQLPPIGSSHSGNAYDNDSESDVGPGELASITTFNLDDTFWWVWMTSLASEEPVSRKAAFGRCALIETTIPGGKWFVMEEQVKGASVVPEEGAYIAEKKSRFGFSRRNRSTRKKTAAPQMPEHVDSAMAAFRATSSTPNKGNMTLDQQAKIRAAAAELNQKQTTDDTLTPIADRRGRTDDAASSKTNSVLTLGLTSTASPAMKWANAYDKEEIRRQYLGDNFAGRGLSPEDRAVRTKSRDYTELARQVSAADPQAPAARPAERELPPPPVEDLRPEPTQIPSSEAPTAPLPPQPQQVPAIHVEQMQAPVSQAAEVPIPEAAVRADQSDTVSQPSAPSEISPSSAEGPAQPNYESYEQAAAAFEESLDTASAPVDSPTPPQVAQIGRKPVSLANVHPAFRAEPDDSQLKKPQKNPQSPAQVAAARAFWQNQGQQDAGTSQENSKEQKKLHKKTGASGGGFKKMFGRKKDDPKRQSVEVSTLQPPSDVSVARRVSLMRKKPVPPRTEAAVPQEDPRPVASPTTHEEPAASEYAESENPSALSRINTKDQEHAHDEFSRFDQGPLTDAPAFVPNEHMDDDEQRTPYAEPHNVNQGYIAPHHSRVPQSQHASIYATPMEADEMSRPSYDDDTQEVDQDYPTTEQQAPVFATDRWAQIRKNAAERNGRPSEDNSMRSRGQSFVTQNTEGASETSGEETIEDRVARIKARVAELTGSSTPSGAAVPRPAGRA